MTIWEHCFWREVEYCKANDRAVIEFKDVDKRVIELSKALEYVPPPEPTGGPSE